MCKNSKNKGFLTCDGNQAAAHIAYMFSETASIYPITPSSTMAEYVDEWAASGRKNIFGETVRVDEMQSEAGAAGAMHGALQAGALSTTFTASQGLLLMIPNMYKVAGELLPGVYHVSARALASHALSIFGDHQDVMAVRQTGCAMFVTGSVQEIMDLSAVAHLSAIKTRVPFVHFFDGFRTSHEIQKIEQLNNEDLAPLIDQESLVAFRKRALNPDAPVARGMAQNSDIYFQAREACNKYYNRVVDVVEDYTNRLSNLVGRKYGLFDYYGSQDAECIIVAMGSVTETIKETIDYLISKNKKVGLVSVHLYRPFSVKHFLAVVPKSARCIAVLDRTKEPGSTGEPLYLDVKNCFYDSKEHPLIVGGRYGLSSKDTTPACILAVYDNLSLFEPKNNFTVGITDDVTFTSLPQREELFLENGTFEAKFYGLGADGTVGANKNSVKIIGDNTNKYCQAYFAYDSKKSGGFTSSHLRFGDKPIRSAYLVNTPDFVACHIQAYLNLYDVTKGLKKHGTFLLNTIWNEKQVKENLPDNVKRYLSNNHINFYIINATDIAHEIGLGNRTNTILQSAFFKITGIIPYNLAVEQMKRFIVKSYGKKGEDVVNMNYAAVERGGDVLKIEVPIEWSDIQLKTEKIKDDIPNFVSKIAYSVNAQKGDDLPVSAFVGYEDGTWEQGTAAYEKRGVGTHVPTWILDNCIQCNQCSYVCPHASIRPFILDESEQSEAPVDLDTLKAVGKKFEGMNFRMQVNVLDCLGCGNCVDVCPGNKNGKALQMSPIENEWNNQSNWDFCTEKVKTKQHLVDVSLNVRNSQFATPLFEFSGACSGCGETPYIKLISQLFGDHQMIANATGCSSIYSGSAPSTPYTKNAKGHGPAWANSLFEDNAEYGFGMRIGTEKMRERVERLMMQGLSCSRCSKEKKALFREWIDNRDDYAKTREIADSLVPMIRGSACCNICKQLTELTHYFVKRSQWIIGGDGWGYDIGFGGLDHVIASGQNINILVLDTEVYSNTGGQSSKSTPAGAVAKFAAAGKCIRKKDLGMMATTYGYVYVAQVAMGANQMQTLKAVCEAESYSGPSLIIAYSPCISHGLKKGMGKAQKEQKLAVECGYWHLWRFDPRLETEGRNPFQLDSKEPDWSKFQDFLKSEIRFSSLMKQYPEKAQELFRITQANAKWRLDGYKRLVSQIY
ncbi:pyruvate:ferredoxin (flavodoxin) oxidoreductase [Candidatus Azobacteroides pseudotrichonymphae]|uniref:Pyruvate-flavodoxin oxidoreductase n=1 Tax=Azobacteroides pseudotrichonymphae genomovar. CFP2 TaxID=511995 RepID=B6YR89_AZOPC|nr:pyruvate:ferredoxin (flavodoxin) oxidoreductase [Candidatus Azobacteroides pseudotrichonymphae]BAG83711.1 putative pyruvate-flavodoxin oxidoreductase [Candidatus Azobacteroides pseudotrichonymphae genomovar. CFP2]